MALLFAGVLRATTVPTLSFEELVDRSETVISGEVTRSWSAWDNEHKYIWTHYEIKVSGTYKGASASTVTISEPGGAVGDRGMMIAGAVSYAPGEKVALFLQRMPNGYLRTAGWAQGKFSVDNAGSLHGASFGPSLELSPSVAGARVSGTSLRTLEGINLGTLRARVAARIAAALGSAK